MSPAVLRRAEVDDVPAVASVEDACFGVDAWSPAHVGDEVAAPTRRCWVGFSGGVGGSGGVVLGWADLGLGAAPGDVADLNRLAVRPGARRLGLGGRLLGAAVEAAREASASALLLEVSAANAPALAFYARAGFTEIDRRRRYYRDDSDALVLSLDPKATR